MRAPVALALAAAVLVAVPSTATANHSELLARWHLDAVDSGFTPDDSGHALQGEMNGNSVLVDGGRFGKALDLASIGESQVDVLDNPTLEPAQITVMAWVKMGSAPPGTQYVVAKGGKDCSGPSYALSTTGQGLPSGRGLGFHIHNGSTSFFSPNAGVGIWDDKWHAVAGTYDGTRLRLYVDGAQVGDGTAAGGTSIAYNFNTDDLRIGNYPNSNACGGGLVFQGLIDETRIYNRALQPFEIAHLQSASASSPPNLPAPPVNTAPPAVTNASAEPHPGDVLNRSPGTWLGSPSGYLEQWLRCNADGGGCVDIAGATDATHRLTDVDVGKTLRIRVRAVNGGGTSAPAESAPSPVVHPGPPPPLVARIAVLPNPNCQQVDTFFDASESTGSIAKYRFEYSEPDGTGKTRTVFVSEGPSPASQRVRFNFNRITGGWYDPATGELVAERPSQQATTFFWWPWRDPAIAKVIVTSGTGAKAEATTQVNFLDPEPGSDRKKCPKNVEGANSWKYPLGKVAKKDVKFNQNTVSTKVPCQSATTCFGGATITFAGSLKGATKRRPSLLIGSRAFAIPPGETRTVTAKLTSQGRKLLRARRTLRVKLVVTAVDPDGKNVTRSLPLTLRSSTR